MSIYKYEEAIVARMREITSDDRIIITPSENMINIIPRIQRDEIKLPLIHMIRQNWRLSNKNSHGMKMNGNINDCFPMYVEQNHDYSSQIDGKIHRVHAIPIEFSHVYEVWTRTREENDEMIRELIWFFSTMSELEVDIPNGIDMKHVFTLELQPEIIDNTNIVSQKDTGELFLQAITCKCTDAYLWKSSSHNPTCIHINTDLKVDKRTPIINQDYNKKTIEESGFEVKNKYE